MAHIALYLTWSLCPTNRFPAIVDHDSFVRVSCGMAAKPSKPTGATSTQAFLSSFYIYNPSLGKTDSTVHDQLIFHYSAPPTDKIPSPKSSTLDSSSATGQDLDKQLRAVGLAQGIVEFARAFSPDSPVQEVRTQKGFTVPVEVEKGWWMLAVQTTMLGKFLMCRRLKYRIRLPLM